MPISFAGGHGKKTFNVVLCPSHLTEKWVRELYETLPDCYAEAVSSISDIERLRTYYLSLIHI